MNHPYTNRAELIAELDMLLRYSFEKTQLDLSDLPLGERYDIEERMEDRAIALMRTLFPARTPPSNAIFGPPVHTPSPSPEERPRVAFVHRCPFHSPSARDLTCAHCREDSLADDRAKAKPTERELKMREYARDVLDALGAPAMDDSEYMRRKRQQVLERRARQLADLVLGEGE